MSPSAVAEAHAEARRRLAAAASLAARRAWMQIDRSNMQASWLGLLGNVLALVSGAQLTAAKGTEPWLQDLLGHDPEQSSSARLNPAVLAGVMGDGSLLSDALRVPVWTALKMVTQGAPVVHAMVRGQILLDLMVRTAVADAGRAADSVGMVARPSVTSYIRVVEGGACSRCIVLAGREYGVSKAFLRHPRCHCGMEPVTSEHRPTPTSPETHVAQMTAAEKEQAFGKAGAKAINEGADIAQVVNARRGMTTAAAYGRTVQATTEGATRRGIAGKALGDFSKKKGGRGGVSRTPRLMPEEIFRLAGSNREQAIQLLRLHSYIV